MRVYLRLVCRAMSSFSVSLLLLLFANCVHFDLEACGFSALSYHAGDLKGCEKVAKTVLGKSHKLFCQQILNLKVKSCSSYGCLQMTEIKVLLPGDGM